MYYDLVFFITMYYDLVVYVLWTFLTFYSLAFSIVFEYVFMVRVKPWPLYAVNLI